MKKYIFILLLAVTGLSACKKESKSTYNVTQQAAADDATIQAYLQANSITATKDPSGVYYQILIQGTGPYPTVSSTVTVNYVGKLLDGTVFDAANNATFPLAGVIPGWQIGIPHINAGGRMRLIVPSTLAYQDQANGDVPPNSILDFTIEMISFK